jgi:2-keto-3-deoxy-L-rhamnonate aldolase RhmA
VTIIRNVARQKLRAGEVTLGFGVQHLRTAAVGMTAARHDWLFIDMEHGAFSLHEATQICSAALPTGVTPIARVCADSFRYRPWAPGAGKARRRCSASRPRSTPRSSSSP